MKDASSSTKRFLESFKREARYCVLDCAVFMEEKISETLGRLLDIDWKKSESLGYGSGSLGFYNKVKLVQDLKEVKNESKSKFEAFANIRNKFAHIAEIDSFASYFREISSSKERRKELKKWFPDLNWDSEDTEVLYKLAYFSLTLELFMILFNIDKMHAFKKGKDHGEKEVREELVRDVTERLRETEWGKKILEDTIEKLKNKESG